MTTETPPAPPTPHAVPVKRRRLPLGWLLPIVGLAVVAYFGYWAYEQNQPNATLTVQDAAGIKAFQTPVLCRGVEVGKVTAVLLQPEAREAEIRMRLNDSALRLATADSDWWIVRPSLGLTDVSEIESLLAGPSIEFRPGAEPPATRFHALAGPPADAWMRGGLEMMIQAKDRGAIEPGTLLRYRGIPIGRVVNLRLPTDGRVVVFTAEVDKPYAHLIRENTVFWHSRTFDATVRRVTLGLDGYVFEVPRLNSAVDISIHVANPNDAGDLAAAGRVYTLDKSAPKGVEDWSPDLGSAPSGNLNLANTDPADPAGGAREQTNPIGDFFDLINPFD
ncbi:MAG: MlaD family protein [Planctomycetota bacterium]